MPHQFVGESIAIRMRMLCRTGSILTPNGCISQGISLRPMIGIDQGGLKRKRVIVDRHVSSTFQGFYGVLITSRRGQDLFLDLF